MSPDLESVEWTVSREPVPYLDAVRQMEERAAAIHRGTASEWVWLLEHPPLYTAGTSAKDHDLIEAHFPVFKTSRGGQYTYHGPGQRVAYVLLNLNARGPDARAYVRNLEEWLIRTLAKFEIKGERRTGRVGIWVASPNGREDKIAAIGVRLKHWVSYHGVSLNVNPDLSHYSGIVPCGVQAEQFGVTSLAALGRSVAMQDVDVALKQSFEEVFEASAAFRPSAAE